jgi:hypothetical protein
MAQTPAPKPGTPSSPKPAVQAAPKPKPATPITIAPGGAAKVGPPATAQAAPAGDPNKVVATVGDVKITRAQFELFVDGLPDELKNMAIGPGKRNVIQSVLDIHQMAAEARRKQFEQDEKNAAQLKFQREQVLANSFMRAEMNRLMADEVGLRAWY